MITTINNETCLHGFIILYAQIMILQLVECWGGVVGAAEMMMILSRRAKLVGLPIPIEWKVLRKSGIFKFEIQTQKR